MRLIRLFFGPLASLLARCRSAAHKRLARASPDVRNPARLSLILKAHWNNAEIKLAAGAINIT